MFGRPSHLRSENVASRLAGRTEPVERSNTASHLAISFFQARWRRGRIARTIEREIHPRAIVAVLVGRTMISPRCALPPSAAP